LEKAENIRLKLKALANLMLNFSGDHVAAGEIQALGHIIHGISQELQDWNLKDKRAAG